MLPSEYCVGRLCLLLVSLRNIAANLPKVKMKGTIVYILPGDICFNFSITYRRHSQPSSLVLNLLKIFVSPASYIILIGEYDPGSLVFSLANCTPLLPPLQLDKMSVLMVIISTSPCLFEIYVCFWSLELKRSEDIFERINP